MIISAWQEIVKNLHIESVNIFSESLRSREIYGVGFIYGFSLDVDDVKKIKRNKIVLAKFIFLDQNYCSREKYRFFSFNVTFEIQLDKDKIWPRN